MANADVRLLSAARREVAEALDWYRERSIRASSIFLDEFESAVERIAESPQRWPVYEMDTRRLVLSRVPFSLIYRFDGEVIEILAVAHQKSSAGLLARPLTRSHPWSLASARR